VSLLCVGVAADVGGALRRAGPRAAALVEDAQEHLAALGVEGVHLRLCRQVHGAGGVQLGDPVLGILGEAVAHVRRRAVDVAPHLRGVGRLEPGRVAGREAQDDDGVVGRPERAAVVPQRQAVEHLGRRPEGGDVGEPGDEAERPAGREETTSTVGQVVLHLDRLDHPLDDVTDLDLQRIAHRRDRRLLLRRQVRCSDGP
jgi:hypothetical protein